MMKMKIFIFTIFRFSWCSLLLSIALSLYRSTHLSTYYIARFITMSQFNILCEYAIVCTLTHDEYTYSEIFFSFESCHPISILGTLFHTAPPFPPVGVHPPPLLSLGSRMYLYGCLHLGTFLARIVRQNFRVNLLATDLFSSGRNSEYV